MEKKEVDLIVLSASSRLSVIFLAVRGYSIGLIRIFIVMNCVDCGWSFLEAA
jgi:hypothetical protein